MKTKVELLEKFAKKLSKVPKEYFDMGCWIKDASSYFERGDQYFKDSPKKCGTAACAIGWFPTLMGKNYGLKLGFVRGREHYLIASRITPFFGGESGFKAVAKYFNISDKEAVYLFNGQFYKDIDNPTKVAKRILNFCKQIKKGLRLVNEFSGKFKKPLYFDENIQEYKF